MGEELRIITWNGRGATSKSTAFWRYFSALAPDVALLQKVVSIPDMVLSQYSYGSGTAIAKNGRPQRFKTWLLSKAPIGLSPDLDSDMDWVRFELDHFRGNLISGQVDSPLGKINILSVYNPAWPIDRARVANYETEGVRLIFQKSDVWFGDVLWSALSSRKHADELWIIGGDFNLSETFDSWAGGGPHGNKEFLDRMADLGLVECLRKHQGHLTPTFRNASNRKIIHQLDHLWVSAKLSDHLANCKTADHAEIFDAELSDHLPIIADFNLPASTTD